MLSISLYLVRRLSKYYLPVWGWGRGPRDLRTASPFLCLLVNIWGPGFQGLAGEGPLPHSPSPELAEVARGPERALRPPLLVPSPARPDWTPSSRRPWGLRPGAATARFTGLPEPGGFFCHTRSWGPARPFSWAERARERERERARERARTCERESKRERQPRRAVWVSFPAQAPNLGGAGRGEGEWVIWPGPRPWRFRPERAAHGTLGERWGADDPGRTGLSEASSEVTFTTSLLSSMHLPDPGSASRGTVVSGSRFRGVGAER